MLPTGLRNFRKKPFNSDPLANGIPAAIHPFSVEEEGRVVTSLLTEVNSLCGLQLDVHPDMSRICDPTARSDNLRILVIGASHMCRTVEQLLKNGVQIESHSKPGWMPTHEEVELAVEFLSDKNPTKDDIVVFDLWSNSAYMGTNEEGMPSPAFRGEDGHYHIPGGLQAAPKPVFQKIFADSAEMLAAAGAAKVVLIIPFPRYVHNPCCNNPGHVTNLKSPDYLDELHRGMDNALSTVAADGDVGQRITLSIMDILGFDKELPLMSTPSGAPVWRERDPVHLTAEAYFEVGRAICNGGLSDGQSGGKRERLDSVVPGPPAKRRAGPIVKPSPWVAGGSGQSGRGRGRGRGGGGGPRSRGRGYYTGRGRGGSRPYGGRGGLGRGTRGYPY